MNTVNKKFKENIASSLESTVTISQKEYGELQNGLEYWKYQHKYAIERLNESKKEIAEIKAKVRDLNQRLFGKKTEKGGKKPDQAINRPKSDRPRGQQKDEKGHGRTISKNLPVKEIIISVANQCCPICGKTGDEMPTTDDCDIIEIEVKAYRRRIRRKKVHLKCDCKGRPEFITGPSPNRLIPKGKLGISVWTEIILDKFVYCNPTIDIRKWNDTFILFCYIDSAFNKTLEVSWLFKERH